MLRINSQRRARLPRALTKLAKCEWGDIKTPEKPAPPAERGNTMASGSTLPRDLRRFPLRRVAVGILAAAGLVALAAIARPEREARVEAKLARVRADFRVLDEACRRFGADICGVNFPRDTAIRRTTDRTLPLTFDTTFTLPLKVASDWCLTTPIRYIDTIPLDPFRPGRPYGYFRYPYTGGRVTFLAFLHSPGPDGIDQIDLPSLQHQVGVFVEEERTSGTTWTSPVARARIREVIDPLLYDPTNGTMSGGDLLLAIDVHTHYWGFGAEERDTDMWRNAPTHRIAYQTQMRTQALPEDRIFYPEALGDLMFAGGIIDYEGNEVPGPLYSILRGLEQCDFSKYPGALTANDRRRLAAMMEQRPRWWGASAAIPDAITTTSRTIDSKLGAQALEMHSRTQLLLAASEAGDGRKAEATARLRMLRMMWVVTGPRNPGKTQWDREMSRTLWEMGRAIKSVESIFGLELEKFNVTAGFASYRTKKDL